MNNAVLILTALLPAPLAALVAKLDELTKKGRSRP